MDLKTLEILGILQEECAEVIQEVSKCRRFGIDSVSYKTGQTHAKMLEQEIGDVLCMIELLHREGLITEEGLLVAKQNKEKKLQKYSNIFEQTK
jgi:NTP pyrophosphatase (non-canonical NTP hydrolase)